MIIEIMEVKKLDSDSVRASVKLHLNECPLMEMSERYPELEYMIHDKQILPDGGVILSLIVKQSVDVDPFFRNLNSSESVNSINFIYFGKDECKVRIDFNCTSCIFTRLTKDLRLSPDYLYYKNSDMVATFSLGNHIEFRRLLKYLKNSGIKYSILEVTHRKGNGSDKNRANKLWQSVPTLTAKQSEVLRHAYRSGYFDRDKKVNMGAIAEHFGVSPATVGVHMRTGMKKIIKALNQGTI